MSVASTATAFTTTGEVAGGFAVVFSRSTTTEPTVTSTGGTETKLAGCSLGCRYRYVFEYI
jgi:hypothetical protein